MSLSLICTTLAVLMVITPSLPAQQMSWPTYHGQPSLDGYTKMALPDRINLVWRLKTEGSLSLTPVSDGMRLFYASERGEVGAVNLHGERVWSTAITNRVRAPLVALPSALIVACESGEVFSLDASSGKTNWMFRTGDIIQGSPNFWCGSDGKPNQILLLTQPNGVLYAVKPQNGHFIWKSHETTRTDGSPAVDGNLVVFGNCSASFHLFSAETGEKVGEIPVGEGCEMAGGVALSSGWIFAGNRRGTLAAADTSTRRVVWTNRDAEGEELFTTPAVSGERVVFP
ncbi:MAG: PQQ-binding-like beta-propeller repeat protein, partial [Kiritimatiellae bacterium]|nr:PQQ-binding-like beta-propeller repeat protein [Kiritimatiellia bacterium]